MGLPFIKSRARKRDQIIAIDLGGRSSKAVHLQRKGDRFALVNYAILDAASGEEALDLCRTCQGPVHLLLTDVVMPGMNGPELAKRIVGERPGTRVLFISGYTDDALARHGALEPGTNLLEKPFSPADVANRVRAILDGA